MSGSNTLDEIDKLSLAKDVKANAYHDITVWNARFETNSKTIEDFNLTDENTKKIKIKLTNLHHKYKEPNKFGKPQFTPDAKLYQMGSSLHQHDKPKYFEDLERLERINPEKYVDKVNQAFTDAIEEVDKRTAEAQNQITLSILNERAIATKNGTLTPSREAELQKAQDAMLEMIQVEALQYKQELTAQKGVFERSVEQYEVVKESRNHFSEEDKAALARLKKLEYNIDPDSRDALKLTEADLDASKPGETLGKLLRKNQVKGYHNSPDGKFIQNGPFGAMLPVPAFLNKWFGASEQETQSWVPGAENVKTMYEATENGKPIRVNSIWMNDHLKALYNAGDPWKLSQIGKDGVIDEAGNFSGFNLGMAIAGFIVKCRMDNAYSEIQKQERKLDLKENFGDEKKNEFKDFVVDNNIETLADLQRVIAADPAKAKQISDMGIKVSSGKNVEIEIPPLEIKKVDGYPPDGAEYSSNPAKCHLTKKEILDDKAKNVASKEDKSFLIDLISQARLGLVKKSTQDNEDLEAIEMKGTPKPLSTTPRPI